MKKSFKRATSIILCLVMLCGCVLTAGAAGKVKINFFGEEINFPEGYGEPFIDTKTSRTLVPARGVFEALDAEVSWDGATRTVYIYRGEDKIEIVIDSLTAKKNGGTITLDQAAVIVGDRTYVPLRFVAGSVNLKVNFDEKTTTVTIEEKEPEKTVLDAGKYEVGKDIKADEYLLIANGDAEIKLLRGEDSGNPDNVITSVSFKTSIYVNIVGCSFIELKNCKIYDLGSVPARIDSGAYKNGMFKVGKDLEAGTYSVNKVVSSQTGTYKVLSKPYSTEGTVSVQASGTVTKETTISLKAGQYILLNNVKMTKQTMSPGAIGGGGGGGSGNRPSEVRPSAAPSDDPEEEPSDDPADEPSNDPADEPSDDPADEPSDDPVDEPSDDPADEPSNDPADEPSDDPAGDPSDDPADEPSNDPADEPSDDPAGDPSDDPADEPSDDPADEPTFDSYISENEYYENTNDLIIDFGNFEGVPVVNIFEGDDYIIYCYDAGDYVDENGRVNIGALFSYWYEMQVRNRGFVTDGIGRSYEHVATGIKMLMEASTTYLQIRIEFGEPNRDLQEELESEIEPGEDPGNEPEEDPGNEPEPSNSDEPTE